MPDIVDSRSLSSDWYPPSSVPGPTRNRVTFAEVMVDQVTKALSDIWSHSGQGLLIIRSPQCNPSTDSDKESHLPSHSGYATPPYSEPESSAHCFHNQCRSMICQTSSLRVFVREILRRSKTTGWTLQAASCYIEAVRPIVGRLLEKDANERLPERHFPSNGEEMSKRAALSGSPTKESHATFKFVSNLLSESANSKDKRGCSDQDTAIRSDLSKLLCPRLTFLAALCLASKFMHDRCCSNRFWANLSGLSVEEVAEAFYETSAARVDAISVISVDYAHTHFDLSHHHDYLCFLYPTHSSKPAHRSSFPSPSPTGHSQGTTNSKRPSRIQLLEPVEQSADFTLQHVHQPGNLQRCDLVATAFSECSTRVTIVGSFQPGIEGRGGDFVERFGSSAAAPRGTVVSVKRFRGPIGNRKPAE
ncbi:hypothetical protein NMY22_g1174 [Coprinellus aureogranulatus]|nr:hypothetical protein NMY22_g1174 [Coprinellus aureogranulatus]